MRGKGEDCGGEGMKGKEDRREGGEREGGGLRRGGTEREGEERREEGWESKGKGDIFTASFLPLTRTKVLCFKTLFFITDY